MKTPAQRIAQLEAIEVRLATAIWGAVRTWLLAVHERLDASAVTAAGGSGADSDGGGVAPDPQIAAQLRGLWFDLVAGRVSPALAEIVRGVVAEELRGTGIPIDSERTWQERYVAELPNRIADIPNEVYAALQADLAEGIAAGDSAADLRNRMAATLSTRLGGTEGDWQERAMLIARTEANRALNGGLQRAWTQKNAVAGIQTYKQWCCVGPDSIVGSLAPERIARRPYDGPMLTLRTADDSGGLSVTPNHQVLTQHGWLRADEVREGDELFRVRRRQAVGAPEVEHRPASIAEIFAACLDEAAPGQVRTMPSGVHLDVEYAVHGEIEVVRADRMLAHHVVPTATQSGFELALMLPDVAAQALLGYRARGQSAIADRSALDRCPGCGYATGDNLGVLPAGTEATGLGVSADDHASFSEQSTHGRGGAAERGTDVPNGHAGLVEATRVIGVEVRPFSGHVYDLQTADQWFACDGLIVHNSTLDGRTRPTHVDADGQTVPVDGYFTVGGSQMQFPGDPLGGPSEVANCRCVMAETETPDPITVDDRQMADGDYGPIPEGDAGAGPSEADGLTSSAASAAAPHATSGVVRDRVAAEFAAGGNTTMPPEKAQTWSGLLAPIGVNSGDRRRLATGGTFSYRDLPLPLMFQDKTGGGHDNSVVVGRILTVDIREDGIYGTGDYLVGEQFAADVSRAIELTTAGLGHVSVDLADVLVEMVDKDGNPISEEALMQAWENGELLDVYDQFTEAKLIGCTQVAKPAFAEAIITLDGAPPVERVPDAAQAERDQRAALAELAENGLQDASGTKIDVGDSVSADPDMKSADDEETDTDAVTGTVTAVDVAADQVTVQPDDTDQSPITVPSAAITVTEKAGEGDDDEGDDGDGGGVPPSAAQAAAEVVEAAEEVVAAAEAGGEDAAALSDVGAQVAAETAGVVAGAEELLAEASAQVESLQAAAGQVTEFRPDAEAFANPQLSQLTPMTVGPVQEDGTRRVFGHVAGWSSCHIGYSNKCVTPPREDNFAYFHIGEVTLADGTDLAVGNLTLGGRHADLRASYRDAVDHYDDSGAGVAVVRAYADAFGIAVAGVITPETTDAQLGQLRRSGLSGDWRRIGGEMRMVGALAVNTGGFPVPRYAADGAGRVMALVAAGSVPQAMRVEESYEDVARRVFAEETQKQARRDEVAALVATASAAANQVLLGDLLEGIEL